MPPPRKPAASITLMTLTSITGLRMKAVSATLISRTTPQSRQCTNAQGDSVKCPPKINTTLVIILVVTLVLVLLAVIGLFLWRVFRQRQIRTYVAVRHDVDTNEAFAGEEELEKGSNSMIQSGESRVFHPDSLESNETFTPPKTASISQLKQTNTNRKEAELHYGYAVGGI